MSAKIWIILVAFLTIIVATLAVYANVEFVNISPSVLLVGSPITFIGQASGSSASNQIGVYVFVGPNCSSGNIFASTYTVANATDTYSVTLSFPMDTEFSGWQVEQRYQQFQNGLPAGSYSVGVADMASMSIGSGGICRNFTVSRQPVPEFSWVTLTLILTLVASLCLVRTKRRLSPNR